MVFKEYFEGYYFPREGPPTLGGIHIIPVKIAKEFKIRAYKINVVLKTSTVIQCSFMVPNKHTKSH